MSLITSAAGLLAAAALKTAEVTIGGVTVLVRELSVAARDEFLRAHADSNCAGTACILRHAVVNADGEALLDEAAAAALVASSGVFVQELVKAVLELSGLGESKASD